MGAAPCLRRDCCAIRVGTDLELRGTPADNRASPKPSLLTRVFGSADDRSLSAAWCSQRGTTAEMKTGEGQTLVATLPLYLSALAGKGGHLVTVDGYLARRDAQWMGPIYPHPLARRGPAAGSFRPPPLGAGGDRDRCVRDQSST